MKKYYLVLVMACFANNLIAQLTVTTSPSSATVCAGNAVSITASAVPVTYTVNTITTNLSSDQGINVLADAGAVVTPYSAGINLDDCRWDNIPLPFNFRFFGNVFNYVNISSNGWVGLGTTNTTTTGLNAVLPNAAAPNNVIHGITADFDLRTAAGGTLEYFEEGVAPNRIFIISYNNVRFLSGGGNATFQIVLKETSNQVEIHTAACTNTTAPKAQGVENGTGTVATVVTGRNNTTNWTATGYTNSYRFTPDNITFTWSPSTGLNTTTGATVIATPATNTTYTINALNTSNSQTGSTTVNVTVNTASYTLAAVAGGAEIFQNISVSSTGTNYRDGNCNLIATVLPTGGATAVSNAILTKVKIDTGATKRGTTSLYLARKYYIEPIVNPYPATSTADVTLYYLQSEFNNYNLKAADSGYKLLPTGPADATGISNLVLKQFHGTGTNPNNYTGPVQSFSTVVSGFTVNWNSTRSWWEVKVPVTSFSGFYITSAPASVLPISLDYFTGKTVDNKSVLSWKVNCTSAKVNFEIQRSNDGINFFTIITLTADQLRCSQPFNTIDEHPLSGINYYRIKIIDPNEKYYYSNIVSLLVKVNGLEILTISPNPVRKENAVLKINTGAKSQAIIIIADFTGRLISNQVATLVPGINQVILNTQSLATGAYQVTVYSAGEIPKTTKLIKQ